MIACDRDRALDLDPRSAAAVAVHIVRERAFAIGPPGDLGANQPLRVVQQFARARLERFQAVTPNQLLQSLLARMARRHLCAQIAQRHVWHADVRLE